MSITKKQVRKKARMSKKMPKGAEKLAEVLMKVSPQKRKKVMSTLSASARKVVQAKLHVKLRENVIKENVMKYHQIREHYNKLHPHYKRLSPLHKTIIKQITSNPASEEAKRLAFIERKSEELYYYYKSRGKKSASPPKFFNDIDTTDRHLIVMKADHKYDIFSKYVYFFKNHRIDEEPSLGVAPGERRFFEEARMQKFGKEPEEETRAFIPGTFADKLDNLLHDTSFLKTLGNGEVTKGGMRIRELVKEKWYRKSNLSELDITALTRLGYVESVRNVWDFNNQLTPVIAFNQKGFAKESLHHFSKAYFTREIIPSTMIREKIHGTEKVVDAAIPKSNKGRIAIEFQETNTLSYQKVVDKVEPICAAYNFLLIVCKEDEKSKYSRVLSNKVFVLNNREFVQLLHEIKKELS